jgi:hypothetical protein
MLVHGQRLPASVACNQLKLGIGHPRVTGKPRKGVTGVPTGIFGRLGNVLGLD